MNTDSFLNTEFRPLTPEARAKDEIQDGIPVILNGEKWILPRIPPGLIKDLDKERDLLFIKIMSQRVTPEDIIDMLFVLLYTNYEVEKYEVYFLAVSSSNFSDAVFEAYFPTHEVSDFYWTDWALSGFIANGIDIASVPEHLISAVVRHLVWSNRMMPIEKFCKELEEHQQYMALKGYADANKRSSTT